MSDTKVPAWAVEAAVEAAKYTVPRKIQTDKVMELATEKLAAIIAKHAPRARRLVWETENDGVIFFADTPFGRYEVCHSWWCFGDEYDYESEGYDNNKAAAQADFERRVAECMEADDAA